MHKNILAVLLLIFVSDMVLAEEVVICSSCRDPQNYARDYGNFTFNVSMGPNKYAELNNHVMNGGVITVQNKNGQSVLVDINAKTTSINVVSIPFLNINLDMTIQLASFEIVVQRANGTQLIYDVSAYSPNLTVGVGNYVSPAAGSTSSSGSEGSDSEDDYSADDIPSFGDTFSDEGFDCSRCEYRIEEL